MIYEYECKKCGIIEIQHKISEERKRCSTCKRKIVRVFSVPHVYVYNQPTTLGHQAARNSDKMSKELLEIKRNQKTKQNKEVKEELFAKKGLKYNPIEKTKVDPDFVMDKQKEKEIFSGNPKEIKKKVKKYIEDGV